MKSKHFKKETLFHISGLGEEFARYCNRYEDRVTKEFIDMTKIGKGVALSPDDVLETAVNFMHDHLREISEEGVTLFRVVGLDQPEPDAEAVFCFPEMKGKTYRLAAPMILNRIPEHALTVNIGCKTETKLHDIRKAFALESDDDAVLLSCELLTKGMYAGNATEWGTFRPKNPPRAKFGR